MASATGVRKIGERVERKDLWWVEPLVYVVILGGFILYATWAALVNGNYYADPYLSPFYSPCLAQNCVHPTLPLLGSWWNLSPAILIVGSPLALRFTCYYYRRTYYRGFLLTPPACLVPDGLDPIPAVSIDMEQGAYLLSPAQMPVHDFAVKLDTVDLFLSKDRLQVTVSHQERLHGFGIPIVAR